ncbi:hypothetical protein P8A18_29095 [Streptomyces castrisilvae]|uniref:Transposase n=1 Tax=Streptomyces castrisilvae TaxID=3033811 RepID=A0ABY9HT23_9ACTN|nr:hypothetical protein [Streptomyces sp. Mut1]WLQ37244.1 hypothetical protein P8A18_29095 [Streptomyces sp. Mut1]
MLPDSHGYWFEEEVWDMSDGPESMKPCSKVWRFNKVCDPLWRLVTKELILARMCPPQ